MWICNSGVHRWLMREGGRADFPDAIWSSFHPYQRRRHLRAKSEYLNGGGGVFVASRAHSSLFNLFHLNVTHSV